VGGGEGDEGWGVGVVGVGGLGGSTGGAAAEREQGSGGVFCDRLSCGIDHGDGDMLSACGVDPSDACPQGLGERVEGRLLSGGANDQDAGHVECGECLGEVVQSAGPKKRTQ